MADKNVVKGKMAARRRSRVRGKVKGTSERPRLTVSRSLTRVSAQLIDDVNRVTLIGLSTDSSAMEGLLGKDDSKTAQAGKVGQKIAELAKEKGIEVAVFDRNIYRYHGRIKAVADGARKGGLRL